jgi:RNA methyltransferase, TrmH family
VITSRDNRWIKQFRAALHGTGPRSGEPIGVEGRKIVEEALRSGLECEALLVSESAEVDARSVLAAASESECGISSGRVLRATDKLFASVSGTETPQGIAGLFRQPECTLEHILRGPAEMRQSAPLVMVLAAIQDPGNVGTILRSAEAFGATGVVATRGTADPWSPKALRASAGSALRLPLLRGIAVPILMAQLKIARLKLFATTSHESTRAEPIASADLRDSIAIFVGNEGGGLPSEILSAVDGILTVPLAGGTESLNAGIAASIFLYEAARQRASERA